MVSARANFFFDFLNFVNLTKPLKQIVLLLSLYFDYTQWPTSAGWLFSKYYSISCRQHGYIRVLIMEV